MEQRIIEVNLDAIVGPTHHYSGLGVGNIASISHRHRASSPKQAALEGLDKAWRMAQTGVPQFLLPPLQRPRLDLLAGFGFFGDPQQQLRSAWAEDVSLVSAIYSSSFMWAANAATVTSPSDSRDGRLHLTVANLTSSLHRSIEAAERFPQLVHLFSDLGDQAVVHGPLAAAVPLRDEGAANHMRLWHPNSPSGLNLFVHGDSSSEQSSSTRFMARQTLAASRMIQRLHQLDDRTSFHLQQHPKAISAGVFHNDVIATSHQNLLIHHQFAFADSCSSTLEELDETFQSECNQPLLRIVVTQEELTLAEAVQSYLFNSQIVCPRPPLFPQPIGQLVERRLPEDRLLENPRVGLPRMLLLAPQQCRETHSSRTLIESWISNPEVPIDEVQYVDLRQSMAGGGGPACLRLRIPLWEKQVQQLAPACRLDSKLYTSLRDTIQQHYPDHLEVDDLQEWKLVEQARNATQAVSEVLGILTK